LETEKNEVNVKNKTFIFSFLLFFLFSCTGLKNFNKSSPPFNTAYQDSTVVINELPPDPQEIEEISRLQSLYSESMNLIQDGEVTQAESTLVTALDIILLRGDDERTHLSHDFKEIEKLITGEYKKLIQRNQVFNAETPPEAIRYEIDKLTGDENEGLDISEREIVSSSFPLTVNRKVENVISFFQKRGRKTFVKWLERSTLYKNMMTEIFREKGIPEDLIYLAMIESGFNPKAISSRYAVGMWQFMSSTGKTYGLRRDRLIDERRDPVKATKAAAEHLKDLYQEYNDWYLAIACYNCSPKRIEMAMRRHKTRDFWKLTTIPRETRNHIPTLIGAILIARNPEKYGFRNIAYNDPIEFERVKLESSIDLAIVSDCINVDYLTLKNLNPELNSWLTPDFKDGYYLKIPKGKKALFLENLSKIPEDKRIKYFPHKVVRGETISSIAHNYRVRIKDVLELNNISNPRRLSIGKVLKIPAHPYVKPQQTYARTIEVPGRKKIIYIVKKGDTLGEIAEIYGVRARDLRYWNNLSYGHYIYPDQKLNVWVIPDREYGNRSSSQSSNTREIAQNAENTADMDNSFYNYLVKKGDTISRISKYFLVSENDISRWNNLSNKNVIYPGQYLKIYLPGTKNTEPDVSVKIDIENAFEYSVKKGDSLWKISREFGVTINQLRKINDLNSAWLIKPGEKLFIPQN